MTRKWILGTAFTFVIATTTVVYSQSGAERSTPPPPPPAPVPNNADTYRYFGGFPVTDNPETARIYATAYIVGEYMRDSSQRLTPNDLPTVIQNVHRSLK